MKYALWFITFLAAVSAGSTSACKRGESPCFCKQVGGVWKQGQKPTIPACRIFYSYQGRQRWANVYFPNGYDGRRRFPLWIQLHGVFWNTMDNVGSRLGAIDATDIIPYWDRAVEKLGNAAVIVYPQSTGNPGTGNTAADTDPRTKAPKYRQFWNIPFWKCSVGVCSDQSVNDVGFIETVTTDLKRRLAVNNKQILLSGESGGGMMVQALLCQSRVLTNQITAAVDLLGGIGKDYALGPACKQGTKAVPFLKIHGMKDPFITWDRDILVDGVNFISAVGGAQVRAAGYGCKSPSGGWYTDSTGKMSCRDMCRSPTVRVCGLINIGHTTDYPWPGFVYQQAWKFFNEQLAAASAAYRPGASARRSQG